MGEAESARQKRWIPASLDMGQQVFAGLIVLGVVAGAGFLWATVTGEPSADITSPIDGQALPDLDRDGMTDRIYRQAEATLKNPGSYVFQFAVITQNQIYPQGGVVLGDDTLSATSGGLIIGAEPTPGQTRNTDDIEIAVIGCSDQNAGDKLTSLRGEVNNQVRPPLAESELPEGCRIMDRVTVSRQ